MQLYLIKLNETDERREVIAKSWAQVIAFAKEHYGTDDILLIKKEAQR